VPLPHAETQNKQKAGAVQAQQQQGHQRHYKQKKNTENLVKTYQPDPKPTAFVGVRLAIEMVAAMFISPL
jgi:hypothetical protein